MRCAVFGCNNCNNPGSASAGLVHYHKFPKELVAQKKWVYLCGRADKFNIKTSRICSAHFEEEDYVPQPFFELYGLEDKRRILKPGAEPSLHLPRQQKPVNSQQALARDERAKKKTKLQKENE